MAAVLTSSWSCLELPCGRSVSLLVRGKSIIMNQVRYTPMDCSNPSAVMFSPQDRSGASPGDHRRGWFFRPASRVAKRCGLHWPLRRHDLHDGTMRSMNNPGQYFENSSNMKFSSLPVRHPYAGLIMCRNHLISG